MAENSNGKNYVLGKGRVFFDQFAKGTKVTTGERYLGNTPEFQQSNSQDSLDHIDSDQGLNVKDESIIIQNDLTGSFVTDNIVAENIAMWFGGDASPMVIAAATDIIDADRVVLRGRTYQLGSDDATPMGTKKVDNVVISKITPPVGPATEPTVTPVVALNNFEIDLERGRVYIEPDAPGVADGDTLRFQYDQEGFSREIIIAKGEQVSGALRFIADNPHGQNKDYYYPYVKITSDGDYALKGDEWQQMSFTFEVLKRDGSIERAYIDGVKSL